MPNQQRTDLGVALVETWRIWALVVTVIGLTAYSFVQSTVFDGVLLTLFTIAVIVFALQITRERIADNSL